MNDEKYMQRCLELAQLGAGQVSPNPMVGAVIVYRERIIGEGFHKRYGQAHAEVNAINMVFDRYPDAANLLSESKIYISLEPCSHFGKTPPCADLIIKHKIPKAIVGSKDPFSAVNGKGIEKLRNAGTEVIEGILEKECLSLNNRFFTLIKKQRPYIILKWAQTIDGFFAPETPGQCWITTEASRKLVHLWRSEEDAILIGKNTAAIDNPKLDVRYGVGKSPKRIVIDRNLTLSKQLHLFNTSVETIVFNALKTSIEENIKYVELDNFDQYLPQYILFQLYIQDIQSIIIEGGAITLNHFIQQGLWDEARIFTGKMALGKGISAPKIPFCTTESYPVGMDTLQIIYNIPKS
ncbi:MAG: bifunctional diaminohydroxyphosphoribosylaminopyrimidine deaminase/5-amino-6-(5-phosphoribosylamino)uracil reductase RibD [Sphingobacteriaceae bacterium]